ncbi:hypothetical protein Nepgr_008020 [Nepenthes gracilis]|uniref:Uncharacterized protein n=1 Tax=Nepenthes gracilis TaxID=150966 RepID=A0AAD3XJ02_NEPGR|nr:hypothetical protein Nepgr_008020 [Nepenthes gracilis]
MHCLLPFLPLQLSCGQDSAFCWRMLGWFSASGNAPLLAELMRGGGFYLLLALDVLFIGLTRLWVMPMSCGFCDRPFGSLGLGDVPYDQFGIFDDLLVHVMDVLSSMDSPPELLAGHWDADCAMYAAGCLGQLCFSDFIADFRDWLHGWTGQWWPNGFFVAPIAMRISGLVWVCMMVRLSYAILILDCKQNLDALAGCPVGVQDFCCSPVVGQPENGMSYSVRLGHDGL